VQLVLHSASKITLALHGLRLYGLRLHGLRLLGPGLLELRLILVAPLVAVLAVTRKLDAISIA
jgi:hypothetical protein